MIQIMDEVRPKWIVYVLMVGIFWMLVGAAYTTSSKPYRTIIILLVYIPSIALCLKNYKYILSFFIKNKFLFLMLVLLFLYALMNAISSSSIKGIRHIIYVQLFLLTAVLLSSSNAKIRLVAFLWHCAYFMVLALTIYSMISFFIMDDNPITRRMWGGLGINHPILGSYYIAFFAIVSLFMVVEYKKYYYLLGLAIFMAFILFAQSRGAYLAYIVALGVYFVFSFKNNKYAVFILLVSILICMVLAYLFIDQIESRGTSRRPDLWVAGIKLGLEKFWFGHGIQYSYGVFVENTPKYLVEGFEHSHNLLIHIFIQLGFLGVLLFGVLWGYCLYISFKNKNLFLAKFLFIYMVFCTVAFQFDAASFIDTPRLEWMVVWLPLWLLIYFLGVYSNKPNLDLVLKEKHCA